MYDLANEMKLVEHELNAAKSKIELLMSANADVARIAGERDAAEKRIKRLEEAGDRLQMLIEEQGWWESVPQEMWRKAKDTK
jgi:hypothetical protein